MYIINRMDVCGCAVWISMYTWACCESHLSLALFLSACVRIFVLLFLWYVLRNILHHQRSIIYINIRNKKLSKTKMIWFGVVWCGMMWWPNDGWMGGAWRFFKAPQKRIHHTFSAPSICESLRGLQTFFFLFIFLKYKSVDSRLDPFSVANGTKFEVLLLNEWTIKFWRKIRIQLYEPVMWKSRIKWAGK